MTTSFLNLSGQRRQTGLILALAAAGLGVAFYGIWIAKVSPALALALGFAPLALVLGVQWPALVLAALLIAVATELSQNLAESRGLPELLGPMAAGAGLVVALRLVLLGERPFLPWPVLLGFGALFLSAGVGLFHTRHWDLTSAAVAGLAKDLILVLLILALIDSPRRLRLGLDLLIGTLGLISVLGLVRQLSGADWTLDGFVDFAFVEERFTGPFPDANFFASYLVFLIPVTVGIVLARPGRGRLIFGLAGLAALTAGLILTGSRGGLLALLLALPVFLPFLAARARVWALALGLAAMLAAGLALSLSGQLAERFRFLTDPSLAAPVTDVAVEGRLASWQVAGALIRENPVLGVGYGAFNAQYQDVALNLGLIFRGEGRSAHSLYLETLAEQGLLGLAVLLAVLAAALILPLATARRLEGAGQSGPAMELRGLVVGLVAMLLARVFLHDAFPVLMWLVVALGLAAPTLYRSAVRSRTPR